MVSELVLYVVTCLLFAVTLPTVWFAKKLTIGRMVFLLFVLDIALTIEAAFYSDVVVIAVLHVITIPAFFALIYFDLVQQHKTKFRCFICGKPIQESEQSEVVRRFVDGQQKEINVHASCIELERHQRKTFSKNSFKKGIPE
jgi:hypothetical protein